MTGPTIDLARVMRARTCNLADLPSEIDVDREDLDAVAWLRGELDALGYVIVRKGTAR